ncbi:MAG: hypothetical protein UY35_C0005G0077 [Candidatus Saccharibacteria bacterium GW2011_GWC2_48_9]|nr:MAG: hypothetical protein UY35_C0005G0077 [Candidatus Saccharibacteria bacterium GW2011_GWC2_48_9]
MMSPNIYLDIDGVLLSNGKSAIGLDSFIAYLDDKHQGNVYWLTTHCKGSNDSVISYLKQFVGNEQTLKAMGHIKPTKWNVAKTEGIDLDQPFIWFDDNLLYGEKMILEQNNALENMILVNLKDKPNSLENFVQDFPIPV